MAKPSLALVGPTFWDSIEASETKEHWRDAGDEREPV
jgi:hypothetical protein